MTVAPVREVAIFADRDGTINADPGQKYYVLKPSDLRLFDVALDALKEAAAWARLFVISNQAGVGKGLMTHADLEAITSCIRSECAARGFAFDGYYYCEHAPDAGCDCRKPGIALLMKASRDHGGAWKRMYFVGDTERDMMTGRNFGCRTVLVMTGKTRLTREVEEWRTQPDAIAPDLKAAMAWIRRDSGGAI